MRCSIITPSYNAARYLPRAVESVRAQEYAGVEHIVVDGGSSDRTRELLQGYDHLRWISEPDEGMYDAINKGLGLASGDVLGYLNADDRYLSDSVAVVMREFARDPDLDFVYGYCTYIDDEERPICTFRALPHRAMLVTTRGRLTFAQPTCFWRRRVHERVGMFDATMRIVGDADFFCRLALAGLRGRLVRRPLAQFMTRQSCLSKRQADLLDRESAVLRARYGLAPTAWRYVLNGPLYFLVNTDSYIRYIRYKLAHRARGSNGHHIDAGSGAAG